MDENLELIWKRIDSEWSTIRSILKSKLPVNQHKMFDDDGKFIDCQRPMMESIICDKTERSIRLFYYLAAADIVSVPEASYEIKQLESGGREIHINGFSGIGLGTGGTQRVTKG